ncbi:hypothetical protein HT031_006096 [Scenedesmus sp. PABB004]|nr:hypothetical protein HT031_006096 [Scenedesmus sp. PABB004]
MRLRCLSALALVALLLCAGGLEISAVALAPARALGGGGTAAAPPRRFYGFGAAGGAGDVPAARYPRGDCATECSHDPAARMRGCEADAAAGIPATACKSLDDPDVCPTLRYLDAVLPENYCMPRFTADCTHPDNAGCAARCGLFQAITRHCVTDALNLDSGAFNASCTYCNMCFDRTGGTANAAAAAAAPYALLLARGGAGGAGGRLFANHWLVMPKAPCTGIESAAPGCTDDAGEHLWANAYYEALRLGFGRGGSDGGGAGGDDSFALMLNPPNRRGVHQLHIHVARLDATRAAPGVPRDAWLLRRLAALPALSTSPAAPTRVLGEGYYNPAFYSKACSPLGRPPRDWARVHTVFIATADPVADLGRSIRPFGLGRALSAASGQPEHGYGLVVMPRRQGGVAGLAVGITWSTDDFEQLDQTVRPDDPIGFSRVCANYIGWRGTASAAAAA